MRALRKRPKNSYDFLLRKTYDETVAKRTWFFVLFFSDVIRAATEIFIEKKRTPTVSEQYVVYTVIFPTRSRPKKKTK